jgi:hypothetical protein
MAQILVPGVCQAKVSGVIGPHPFVVIFHYKQNTPGSPFSAVQLENIATSVQAGIGSFIAPLSNTAVNYELTTVTDIGQAAPASPGLAATGHIGTATGVEPPPSTCMVVQNIIADRYRGGHPRNYFPGGSMSQLASTEDQWLTGFVNEYTTAVENLHDGVFNAVPGITSCAVRYTYTLIDDAVHHKYHRVRTGVLDTPTVVNWIAKGPIGTQRRRNRS